MSVTIEAKGASKLFVILFFFCLTQSLIAQNIIFDVKAPPVVSVGEPFRLEYILKGTTNGVNFKALKSFNGFDILRGPHISDNSSRADGDNQVWQSFLYIVRAKKTGMLSMPVVSIELGDTQYKTNEVQLKVLAENENSTQYQYDIDAFLRTQISKSEIYEDEAVVLSCRLYTKEALLSVKEINYPTLDGFEVGSKPFYDHQGIPVCKREEYNGTEYYVTDLRKITIYPNHTGQLAIPEVEATLTFDIGKLNKDRRGYYSGEVAVSGVDKRLKSEPTLVKVISLPKKKPLQFSGAIGTFRIRSEVKGSQSKVGELFALKVIVEGYGDLNIATAPVLDLPDGVEVYDMMSDENVFFSDFRLNSDRTFGYLLLAEKAGTYKIPAAKFIYLDTESGNYKTLMSSEHVVSITEPKIKGSVVAYR